MLFTETSFFPFFGLVLLVHWTLTSNAHRKIWLLVASALFYATWDWRFLGLVLIAIVNVYLVTILLGRLHAQFTRRLTLSAGIVVGLGLLGFFKYYDFFIDSLDRATGLHVPLLQIILPVGISFFTFHALSYMIDTYRGQIVPTLNFCDVALYVLFFPQLVAGPIVRATDLLPQMREARSFGAVNWKYLLILFLLGYFKKAVISDNLSGYVDHFFGDPGKFGAGDALLGVFFYAVQIYCDFSGYTDMAIATAAMLGYELKANFNHPYLAGNLIDFWRRWHISLSSWLRDYLYIPLGGNRHGTIAQVRNVLLTMLLGGLWHGAAWTFVVWGGLHGLGLIACRAWFRLTGRSEGDAGRHSVLGNLMTFAWVCFAWIFFRAPTFEAAQTIIGRFAVPQAPTLIAWQTAIGLSAVLISAHVMFYRLNLRALSASMNGTVFAACYGAVIALILPFVNIKVEPFIYFQF
jgi:alginate O-acetyltransferase complex protein AlgI